MEGKKYKHLLAVPETKEERVAYASVLNQIFKKNNVKWKTEAMEGYTLLLTTPLNDPLYHTLIDDICNVYLGLSGDNNIFIGICGEIEIANGNSRRQAYMTKLKENGYNFSKENSGKGFEGIQKQILCIEDAVEELKFIEDTFKSN